MKFVELELAGAYRIELDRMEDERGFFARAWCAKELESHGLDSGLVQINVSFNRRRGTIRGMHLQVPPRAETKVVRCTRGVIYDVIVDLRADSPTLHHWTGCQLSAENGSMLYIPQGFAHGFQTLEDGAEVMYQMSEFYSPEHARGLRWNDPFFGIEWPLEVTDVSARDRSFPSYSPERWAADGGIRE